MAVEANWNEWTTDWEFQFLGLDGIFHLVGLGGPGFINELKFEPQRLDVFHGLTELKYKRKKFKIIEGPSITD